MAVNEDTTGGLQKIKWAWLSDSNGDAAIESTTKQYNGVLWKLITAPGDSDLAPTAAYDIFVYDADGIDQLCGLGADRSATAVEFKSNSDGLGCVKSSKLGLVVDAAGEGNTGQVILYILDMDKGVIGT